MRQDDRPFWQEVREELDPRKNVVGWAAAIIMLVVVCVFGGINDHPAEPAMRPATIVSKSGRRPCATTAAPGSSRG